MESVCGMDVRADPSCQEWPPLEIAMQPPNPGGRPENQGPGEIGLMDEEAPIFEERRLSDDPSEMESVCRMDVRADPPCQGWTPLEITTQPPNPGGRPENQGPGEIGLTD